MTKRPLYGGGLCSGDSLGKGEGGFSRKVCCLAFGYRAVPGKKGMGGGTGWERHWGQQAEGVVVHPIPTEGPPCSWRLGSKTQRSESDWTAP